MDKKKQSAAFVFKDYQNFSGFGTAYASLLGLLQSAFGMTGYDATAHMTEEMRDARNDAPKAIIWSVWIGTITGLAFLIAVCFCIVNINDAAMTPTGVPLIQILYDGTASKPAALALTICITIIALISLCFLCAQSSRVVFAFARDRGLPFSGLFSRVDKKRFVPVYSILLVLGVNMALMSIYFGSITGFNTVLAISTEGFCECSTLHSPKSITAYTSADLSYIMPLFVRIWGRLRGRQEIDSAYSLGRFGMLFNVVGILYLAFACITFNFPSVYPVNSSNMNYTCAAVAVSVLIALVTWFTTGRKQFTGPQTGAILTGRAKSDEEPASIKVQGKI